MRSCICGSDKVIARGLCKKCYDKWYLANKGNPNIQFKQRSRLTKKTPKNNRPYPISHVITVWECSDGREFDIEVDALRYELELFRAG